MTIGRAVPGLHVFVLDDALEPVGPDVIGELYVAGEGLTRGYLASPDRTAERFIPHPYGPPGARLYRTGDRCAWTGDGRLQYVGRVDNQLKIRGFRVEPGEVEAVLSAAPGVEQVVVGPFDDAGQPTRLAAWYSGLPEEEALRRWCEVRLPTYLRPAAYVRLDALPVTSHGKVDRNRLPQPLPSEGKASSSPPRGTAEIALAAALHRDPGRQRSWPR